MQDPCLQLRCLFIQVHSPKNYTEKDKRGDKINEIVKRAARGALREKGEKYLDKES
jgi:hypothetical protein